MNRIDWLDIAKRLGIILMVIGHSGGPFTKFIYLFHMALFFIISGYLYSEIASTDNKSICKYILRKIKSLWMPYFVWTSLFVMLNNIFIKIGVYTCQSIYDKNGIVVAGIPSHNFISIKQCVLQILDAFKYHTGTEMGGAFWFVTILFYSSIMFCICDFIFARFLGKDKIVGHVLCAYVCLLLFWNNLVVDWCYTKVLVGYFLMSVGYVFKCIELNVRNLGGMWGGICSHRKNFIVALIAVVILIIATKFGSIELSINQIHNPWFFVVVSIAGWFFICSIAKLVASSIALSKVLAYIGKNTWSIMALHFLSFKLINYIYLRLYDLPFYYLASFPTIANKTSGWWLVYSVCGVVLPLVCNFCFKRIKDVVK